MKLLKQIWISVTTKNPELKHLKKSVFQDKTKMPENIYGRDTKGESLFFDHIFMFVFKTKFLVPLLFIAKTILKPMLTRPIKKTEYNREILVWDTAFEETLLEWCRDFLGPVARKRDFTKEELAEKYKNGKSVNHLRTINRIALQGPLNDVAYREFFARLAHNFVNRMIQEFKGEKVYHLSYSSHDVYDVDYFTFYNDPIQRTKFLKMVRKQYDAGIKQNDKK